MYECEAWTTTSTTERKLKTFENKIWRKICGPLLNAHTRVSCEEDTTTENYRIYWK